MNVEEQGSPAVCEIIPEGEQTAPDFGAIGQGRKHVPIPEVAGEEIEQMRGLNCEDCENNLGLRIEGDVPGSVCLEALTQDLTDGNAVEVLQADGELGGLLDSPSMSNSVEKMINEDILALNEDSEDVSKEDMAVRKEMQDFEIESSTSDEVEGVRGEESDEVLVTDGVENDDHEDDYVEKGDEVEFSEKGSEIREKGEKQCEYAVDEGDSGDNEEVAIDEIESPADDEVGSADCGDGSASYEEEHLVGDSCSVYGDEAADVGGGEGDSAAGNDEEWADDEAEYSINDEHGNEGVEEEGDVDPTEGRNECGKYDDGDDNRMGMEEDSNVDEYDEYEFNSEEWLDWLERGLRYVRGGNLMHEVLKEIHSYMRVVYDVQQQVFREDESSIALKGCIILSEIVRASPVRGLLHQESELGYQLLMNEEVIGRSLCRWAWRKFRRDWEEKLMRLDVNYYCN
nr:hypothetical protein Iba_chr11cCG9560 [Ipomoea batatas]